MNPEIVYEQINREVYDDTEVRVYNATCTLGEETRTIYGYRYAFPLYIETGAYVEQTFLVPASDGNGGTLLDDNGDVMYVEQVYNVPVKTPNPEDKEAFFDEHVRSDATAFFEQWIKQTQ